MDFRVIKLGEGRCLTGRLFGHKHLELTARRLDTSHGLRLSGHVQTHGNHPGVDIFLGLGRFTFQFAIYDSRHAEDFDDG